MPRHPEAPARRRALWGLGGLLALLLGLAAWSGLRAVAQVTVNGLVAGTYFSLGAVGLTLVYGVLRLVNFAHGDLLTFGAYIALLLHAAGALPFPLAVVAAAAASAVLGVAFELGVWRPMRERGANLFQLLLMTIGLAFLIRNGIQFFAGGQIRSFDVDIVTSVQWLGLRIGRMQLAVVVVGLGVLAALGLFLRYTALGKEMRAVADDMDLAEAAGVDTRRVIVATWVFSAGLAGLAGVLYAAAIGVMNPNLGFSLLLSLFAAAVLGGIGNAFGALAGGLLIGVSQEWATLLFNPRWKPAVGFVILVLTLLARPQGLFGLRRTL